MVLNQERSKRWFSIRRGARDGSKSGEEQEMVLNQERRKRWF